MTVMMYLGHRERLHITEYLFIGPIGNGNVKLHESMYMYDTLVELTYVLNYL